MVETENNRRQKSKGGKWNLELSSSDAEVGSGTYFVRLRSTTGNKTGRFTTFPHLSVFHHEDDRLSQVG